MSLRVTVGSVAISVVERGCHCERSNSSGKGLPAKDEKGCHVCH